MGTGAITQYVDVAQLVLYAFWIFFFGLIYYLVRENHREGYPMDHDGRGHITGWPTPEPKEFLMYDGSTVTVPRAAGLPAVLQAEPAHRWAGAPLVPTAANPLLAGVGPGAWSERADVPDITSHGNAKIRPLRVLPEYNVSAKDTDPRGLPVLGADGEVAGTVADLWIDGAEHMFRYLEVRLPQGMRTVLLPLNFARLHRDRVQVKALLAHQFADVPGTKSADQITFLEEEKIVAYFGAGTLYAEPSRAEPLV